MNFHEALTKKEKYFNEQKLFENSERRWLWDRVKNRFQQVAKQLYLEYDVKDFYFTNDFVYKDKTDNISVLFELNSIEEFEDLADSEIIKDDFIEYFCKVGEDYYVREESIWRKYNKDRLEKILIKDPYE
jgi:hypothetical protein